MNIQTLIDKAGGVPQLASLVGVGRTTVLDWRRTGFIPGNRVSHISAVLDIPAQDLLTLVAPAKKPPPADVMAAA